MSGVGPTSGPRVNEANLAGDDNMTLDPAAAQPLAAFPALRPRSSGVSTNLLEQSMAYYSATARPAQYDPRVSSEENDRFFAELRSPDLQTRAAAYERLVAAYKADPEAVFISLHELSSKDFHEVMTTAFPESMPGLDAMQAGLKQASRQEVAAELKKELAGAKTPKEFNAIVAKHLADPRGAAGVSALAESDPAFLDRIAKDGSKETKKALAHAALADDRLPAAGKTALLQRLTDPKAPKEKLLSLDEVIQTAPRGEMEALARAMHADPAMAVLVAKSSSKDAQLKVMRSVLDDPTLKPDDRTKVLRSLLQNTSKDNLNYLVSHASMDREIKGASGKVEGHVNEQRVLAGIVAGSVPLQERVGHDLNRANQQTIVDETLKLPLPKAATGKMLWVMMHPGNMSAEDKNALVDHLQDTARMPAFLETQVYMPFHESLLPGLSAENTAAVAAGFEELAKEPPEQRVADPKQIGRSVSKSDADSYSKAVAKGTSRTVTTGSSDAHAQSETEDYGVSFTEKGKIGIPFVAEGEVSSTQHYKHVSTTSDTHTTSESDAKGSSRTDTSTAGYVKTYGETRSEEAVQKYDRDVKNRDQTVAFSRAARNIDDYAQNRGGKFKESYRKEKADIH